MRCKFCDKEIRPGQRAYEFHHGIVSEDKLIACNPLGVWCEPCEGDRQILSLKSGDWKKDKYWTKEEV